jgi:holo-[acyl-carrier protein] synthase
MIVGLGIDIVSIERIEALLGEHGDRSKERLFSDEERAYCEALPHAALHFAARFAAKEAFVKALGTGFDQGLQWRDIAVVNAPGGKPSLTITGKALEIMQTQGVTRTHVSLTHDPIHAAAVVILEAVD